MDTNRKYYQYFRASLLNPIHRTYLGANVVEKVKSGSLKLEELSRQELTKMVQAGPNWKKKRSKYERYGRKDNWNIENSYDGRDDFHTFGYADEYWQD